MPTLSEVWPDLLAALTDHYGWPDPGPAPPPGSFAALLAATLGRTVEPRKVGRALDALREAGLLSPDSLAEADPAEVDEALRSRGLRLSAPAVRPLQKLARWVVEHHDGEVESLQDAPTESLREELIGLNGIGPASADAILLHGLGRPVSPVDRASVRILVRHGWLDPSADYEEARSALSPSLADAETLSDLSTWFTQLGRDFCRPSSPRCDRCPLRPFLPDDGPRDPEG